MLPEALITATKTNSVTTRTVIIFAFSRVEYMYATNPSKFLNKENRGGDD